MTMKGLFYKFNLDSLGIVRVPGIALLYSSLAATVPPMFAHFITNFLAFHQILIFVTLETLIVPKVPVSDHILVGRIGPPDLRAFWCIVRYGYKDARDNYNLETQLIEKVEEFVQRDFHEQGLPNKRTAGENEASVSAGRRRVVSKSSGLSEEVQELIEAREAGVAYMVGNTGVVAIVASPIMKKFAINVVYSFLRRNSRRPASAPGVTHTSLIEVGIAYHV